MKKLTATLSVVATVLLSAVVLTPTASAHNVLISSDPAEGAVMETGPSSITLTFDAAVQPGDVNQIAVIGPDDTRWNDGALEVKNNVVTAPVEPLGPAGKYTIGYRILSADGHSVGANITFTLSKAGTGTPIGQAESSSASGSTTTHDNADHNGSSVPLWAWIVGAVVLLGIGLTVALRTGRSEK